MDANMTMNSFVIIRSARQVEDNKTVWTVKVVRKFCWHADVWFLNPFQPVSVMEHNSKKWLLNLLLATPC